MRLFFFFSNKLQAGQYFLNRCRYRCGSAWQLHFTLSIATWLSSLSQPHKSLFLSLNCPPPTDLPFKLLHLPSLSPTSCGATLLTSMRSCGCRTSCSVSSACGQTVGLALGFPAFLLAHSAASFYPAILWHCMCCVLDTVEREITCLPHSLAVSDFLP